MSGARRALASKALVLAVSCLVAQFALGSRALAWGPDVLVKDEATQTDLIGQVVGTSTRGYFLVRDNKENDCMDILRSTDGGRSWWQFFWVCGGSAHPIAAPSITVPERTEDYLYSAFLAGSEIWLLRVNLNNPNDWWIHTIASSSGSSYGNPIVLTDNREWMGYFVYVAYSEMRAEWDFAGAVAFQRSFDKGASWTATTYPGPGGSAWLTGMAYGHNRLYLTSYLCYYGCGDIYVSASGDYGGSWTSVVAANRQNNRDIYSPRVAAVGSGSQVLLVYSLKYSEADRDLFYSYSADGGATWTKNLTLAGSSLNATDASVVADPKLGKFHVVYTEGGNVKYTSVPSTNFGQWSYSVTLSDGNRGAGDLPPSVAVDWSSDQAGVAWTDTRTATSAIYFDRVDY